MDDTQVLKALTHIAYELRKIIIQLYVKRKSYIKV